MTLTWSWGRCIHASNSARSSVGGSSSKDNGGNEAKRCRGGSALVVAQSDIVGGPREHASCAVSPSGGVAVATERSASSSCWLNHCPDTPVEQGGLHRLALKQPHSSFWFPSRFAHIPAGFGNRVRPLNILDGITGVAPSPARAASTLLPTLSSSVEENRYADDNCCSYCDWNVYYIFTI